MKFEAVMGMVSKKISHLMTPSVVSKIATGFGMAEDLLSRPFGTKMCSATAPGARNSSVLTVSTSTSPEFLHELARIGRDGSRGSEFLHIDLTRGRSTAAGPLHQPRHQLKPFDTCFWIQKSLKQP